MTAADEDSRRTFVNEMAQRLVEGTGVDLSVAKGLIEDEIVGQEKRTPDPDKLDKLFEGFLLRQQPFALALLLSPGIKPRWNLGFCVKSS